MVPVPDLAKPVAWRQVRLLARFAERDKQKKTFLVLRLRNKQGGV
jgi:hypothetical protein